MSTKRLVRVEGNTLQLSNLDKLLWPDAGLTKAALLDYFVHLQEHILAHWGQRALTVQRYPHGVGGDSFYQKNVPASAPSWVSTHRQNKTNYVVAKDLSTIIWLANTAALEFHPSTYLVERPDVACFAIIDLDPTAPLGFEAAVEAAKYCREFLEDLGLLGYPKLSGATGIHIYIPLLPHYDFTMTSNLVRYIGARLKQAYPDKITLERLIKNRRGIYIDFLQNHPSKTIVGAYSPRPTREATVSTPLTWDDLDSYEPRDFTVKTIPKWIQKRGDLFQSVLTAPQSLENLEERLRQPPG